MLARVPRYPLVLAQRRVPIKTQSLSARTPASHVRSDKTAQDIEKLLVWSYRDELSKEYTSSAENMWKTWAEYGKLGGMLTSATDRRTPQRYDFGEPHPDAITIGRAVSALSDVIVDWSASRDAVMGDLAPLLVGRDVLLVKPFRLTVLVTMHAHMNTRPDWHEEPPRPCMVEPERGPKNHGKIIGTCEGKNRYSTGAYCPLTWQPSPMSIALARLDYAVWWHGLCTLAANLRLERFTALPPSAPAQPWNEAPVVTRIHLIGEHTKEKLPLHPQRDVMAARIPRQRSPMRQR